MMQPASIRFDSMMIMMVVVEKCRRYISKVHQVAEKWSRLVSSRPVPLLFMVIGMAWHGMATFFLKEAPFLPSLVVRALFARGRLRLDRRRRATRGRGQDGGEAVFRPLVARVGGSDVPFVRLQRVPAAADAHFCEVADGVFGFW